MAKVIHRDWFRWYLNKFLYLFGEGLETLLPCLDAWSFLVEPGVERMIIGRNAYGAFLVAEEPSQKGSNCSIHILDPISVTYWSDPNLDFVGLIGNWLPQNKVKNFLDSSLYDAWVEATNDSLNLNEVLGIKVPLPLGGEWSADNFQPENIIDYYQTTGEIYTDALNS